MLRSYLALAALCPLTLRAAAPLQLAVSSALTSPYVIEDPSPANPLRGRAIELAQAALRNCGLQGRISRQPGERIVQNLQLGRLDGALLLSYTDERSRLIVFPLRGGQPDPERRMTTLSYAFYVRNGSPLHWDGNGLYGINGTVGVNQGWSIGRELMARGIDVEESVGIEDNFAKLQAGRTDAYVLHQLAGDLYLRHHPELKIHRMSPPLRSKPYYWVFSRGYAREHARQVECLWRQMPQLRPRYLPEGAR
ncbi:transporter substrate-binding domain-containing protein [Chromobacterium amazonense]|uniref:Transporter substrate-binding domain-containing protein n=1 Tax=Chromobacterium amazonense TaxID=1382803 RepID=A0ABU8V221_9NEIS|nr:transporter substrate-binding domain-containing protein [Chromobacterium amazonense]MDQ4542765.1 transporter substrate-binding domain-containing protein [Chromobacterium amazonense]